MAIPSKEEVIKHNGEWNYETPSKPGKATYKGVHKLKVDENGNIVIYWTSDGPTIPAIDDGTKWYV